MGKQKKEQKDAKKREHSLARSHSRPREPSEMGLKDNAAARVAKSLDKKSRKVWEGLSGEGDQRKSVHLVKWMNTGKKRMGTHKKAAVFEMIKNGKRFPDGYFW